MSVKSGKVFFYLFYLLFSLCVALTACHRSHPSPPPPTGFDAASAADNLIAEGDQWFLRAYLYGWRKAEDYYAKAYEYDPSPQLARKLLLVRVLRFTREVDEEIPTRHIEPALTSTCNSPADEFSRTMCDFALGYRDSEGPAPPRLEPGQEMLESYMRMIHERAMGKSIRPDDWQSVPEGYKSSPLFVFLAMNDTAVPPTGGNDMDGFAELHEFRGENALRTKNYAEALSEFEKALEFIPDYTKARIELGNIYLYTLEQFDKALEAYQAALKWDPTNKMALYGKAVALNYLGRFADSNHTFDRLLSRNQDPKGHVEDLEIPFYRGMTHYYMASNYDHLLSPDKAREEIDFSKDELPDSDQVNYLSGVLYFKAGRTEAARVDLQKALSSNTSNCTAYSYLGSIYLQKDEYRATDYLLGMCSCIESAFAGLQEEIASVSDLQLRPKDRHILRTKLKQNLAAYSRLSGELIRNATKIVSATRTERKTVYVKIMKDLLDKIETPADSNTIRPKRR